MNLSPDKGAVIREIRRILKPTGGLLLAEITLADEEENLRAEAETPEPSLDEWFR